MAKLVLTTPVSGGELYSPGISQARVFNVRVDHQRNVVSAVVQYGNEVDGNFVQAPLVPPNALQVVADLNAYADVKAAWVNFERKLFQRGVAENLFPPGTDQE